MRPSTFLHAADNHFSTLHAKISSQLTDEYFAMSHVKTIKVQTKYNIKSGHKMWSRGTVHRQRYAERTLITPHPYYKKGCQ